MVVLRVVVFVTFITMALATSHQQSLKEHYDHLAYIAEYNCQVPQVRVVSVADLLPQDVKAYFPDVTVLHRCDSYVGCCPGGHHCRPKHTETLHLPFKATYLKDTEKFKRGSWNMEYHDITNHTECYCEEEHHHEESDHHHS